MASKVDTTVAVALGDDLLTAVDAYAGRMERQLPGFRVNRTNTIRNLIMAGLESKAPDLIAGAGNDGLSDTSANRTLQDTP